MRPRRTTLLSKELPVYRRLLLVMAVFYSLWWFAVELVLPDCFNPGPSRLAVVSLIALLWAGTYWSATIRKEVRGLVAFSAYLLTFHYFYLFYGNGGDNNWVIGCYITVLAVNQCFFTRSSLLAYSLYVLFLSVAMAWELPNLRYSVFLPGLVTLSFQANLAMRSRWRLIQVLGESNDRFRLLFDSTFEGVLVHEQGRIVAANASLARLLGISAPEELIGRKILDIIHPSDRAGVREKIENRDSLPYESGALAKDGSRIEIEVRGKDFIEGKRRARLVTLQPIGDRKRAAREAAVAFAMSQNVRVRDEFISIASHELKTPLTSLKLQIQMGMREIRMASGNPFSVEKLSSIFALFLRQTDRLAKLVETMLDVSRISSGRLALERRPVDLAQLVKQTVESFADPKAVVEVTLPDSLILDADALRLEQVLENLLANAGKYGEGRPLNVEVHQEDGDAVMTVQDHGRGISPEFQERIFNRFERAESSRNTEGLGLGLYIARQIVEAHGGRISVESTPGHGSRFKVQIPLATSADRIHLT